MQRSVFCCAASRWGFRSGLAAAAFLATVVLLPPSAAWAQKYTAGDEIQVFFLNKWLPAVVVDTNQRGEVLAEFEFANTQKRQPFKSDEVRFAFEAGALIRARFWSDASGKFRTRAALLGIEGEQVVLRKPDMSEIKVPIDKLSDEDQRFIKRLEQEAGPAALRPAQPPPVERFAEAQASAAAFGSTQRAALQLDPVPSHLKIKQGGVAFPTAEFFDRIGAVLPLGGAESWLLAAVENANPSQPLPTRLLWVSLEQQKVAGTQLLPAGEVVLDYHARSHRLLTSASVEQEGSAWGRTVLTLWEVLPTDKQVTPVVRWHADSAEDRPRETWARLVDGDTVIQRYSHHDLVAWDAAGKRMLYRINQESFFAPPVTLSGGGKYLFIPEDDAVRVLESASGRQVSALPAEDGAAGVAVSEDGRRAAVLGRTSLTVWDLTDPAQSPDTFQAEAIGTPFAAQVAWVGPQRLMVDTRIGGQVLFSLNHRLALWNYQFDGDAVRDSRNRRVREIIDEHLVYAASVSSGSQQGLAVGAVQLPGPKVEEVASSLDRESLLIIKPRTPVRLDVRAGGNTVRVRAALEREIANNGWLLSPSASTAVIAEMKRGETQQVTYTFFGQPDQSATVTPYISTLRIEVGDQLAWSSGTSSGAPPVITLEEGQSVQSEIDRWQRPYPEFFDQLDIPDSILDPAKRNGLGTTRVTNRGLIVD